MTAPDFQQKYEAARRAEMQRSAEALQSHLGAAIDALGEIVADRSASRQTRINAAEAIIRNSLKLTERADVLDRLDALERRTE